MKYMKTFQNRIQIAVNTRILGSHLTGAQRYTLELLSRFGNKVEVIKPSAPMHGVIGHAWEQLVLPGQLRGKLLFSPSNTGPLAVKNQVLTIHDVVPLDHPEWLNPRFATWYQFLIQKLAKRVAHVLTVSEFSKQRLLAHVPMDEHRITVTLNGVDKKLHPMSRSEVSTSLSVLQLPSQNYVLCVGSIEPRKNIARLIKAWSLVQHDIPDDTWLILTGHKGNARVFADVAGLSTLPPRVHLTGHVDDEQLPALYAGATAFVYPSEYEGFGLPPLEAMASGVPVLTGNMTALPEVIGDAGLMVDPFDVEAIADGLKRIILDSRLREELRMRGLERAKRFTWDATAEDTWNILQQVANE